MKKKILSLTLAVCIALTLFSGMTFYVSAATSGYYTYSVSNGKATITKCNSSISGDVKVPSTLGGYTVKAIEEGAFLECKNIKTITIPNTVESIGYSAFERCYGLTAISLPGSLKEIELYTFKSCSSLKSISIPGKVKEIGPRAFKDCSSLASVSISNSVQIIGEGAFEMCVSLKSINIPDSVTSIGLETFYGCKNLTTFIIPNKVKRINELTFKSCFSLKSIFIPKSVTEIDESAFLGCTSVTDVYYAGNLSEKEKIKFVDVNGYVGANQHYLKAAAWHYNCFPDVNYNDWYGPSVEYVANAGLMTGYSNGKFGTTDGIQRQDFVIILSRISGDDLSVYKGRKSFKDVDPNAYYAPALAWAKDKGVSNGYNDGSFGVGRKVTREQIMTFLHNYAKLKKYSTTVSTIVKKQILVQYPDFGNVSDFAKEATYWALSKGVISGKQVNGKRYISPVSSAQRCEVAAMFYNINKKGIFAK